MLLASQFFEQRLGFLQVYCVKPFGEPAIDLRQQLARLFPLAVLLPQPSQARCRSQFQQLCLLLAGDLDGLEKTRFGFGLGVRGWGLGVGDSELWTPNSELVGWC
jgi:hypothetical protein